ncbi:MAG TPA: polysaccharide lyase family protein [Verrucomicrobiae bacterium]
MLALGARAFGADVTVSEDPSAYTLANGVLMARVNKRSGDLVSLQYQGLELMGRVSGHPAGYWEQSPARLRETNAVTINPARNGGERGEVSIKGFYTNSRSSFGLGSAAADIEIRYALARGDSGLYAYAIFSHGSNQPRASIGESRFAAKLNPRVFDYMIIDSRRQRLMPAAEDWDSGAQLNMKEARRMTTGRYIGQVEHKYDYSAIQFDIPAFGWAGTKNRVGFWFINPSTEYLSGGATKVELTGHLDDNEGAAPTLLNYWRGSHYGGSVCSIGADESWSKVIGPFMIYCNGGAEPAALWKEALARAAKEAAKWPYGWVEGVDYPHKSERGSATGQILLTDKEVPDLAMSNILAGLAAPDYAPSGGRGFGGAGPRLVDWQTDAKYYQFWTRGDARGRFKIENVRPGTYTLHVIADGVAGELARTNVSVAAGQTLDLGQLDWQPVHFGRPLWQIGIPNRSAEEFLHGDHYWQWGLYYQYTNDFPKDVNYTIGRSDFHKDWNYAEVPRGRGRGTTWTVHFSFAGMPRGKATLRLGLAAASVRGGIEVTVNDKSAGSTGPLLDTATVRRDGIRGYWTERDVAFDGALLKDGGNTLQLSIPGGDPMNGVEYDFVRLELGE